ncbi:MAG: 2Fe-2S iron-sulfur cluster-binding protein, partial [Terriglobales bacterium]
MSTTGTNVGGESTRLNLINLTIDGHDVTVPLGTTVFDAARTHGIAIPTLCHQQNETPVGVCRVCVVEIAGGKALGAACIRPAEAKMVVTTNSDTVLQARKTLYELLLADHPLPCTREQNSGDCELEGQARAAGVTSSRFPKRQNPRGVDDSSLSIAVDHDACIMCDRCVRGCSEIRHNDVIARMGKGYEARIAFDQNLPMGASSCVSCGECMVSCPTGALTNKKIVGQRLETGDVLKVQELL